MGTGGVSRQVEHKASVKTGGGLPSTEELDSCCSRDYGHGDSKPHPDFPLQVLDLFLQPHDALRQ